MAQASGEASGAVAQGQPGEQPAQQQQQRTWGGILKSFMFQMVIFYLITSYFRGNKTPSEPPKGPDGELLPFAGLNLFKKGEQLEMKVYLTLAEDFHFQEDQQSLVWDERLRYGDWDDGPNRDGTLREIVDVVVPEPVQQNGTWFLHVFMAKSGHTIDSTSIDYKEQAITYQSFMFSKYRKRRIHNTANLLTGESDVAPGSMKVAQGATGVTPDIISYYHPNLTINLIEDYTRWTQGSIPQPLDKFVEFDPETGGYYPILHLNTYWNLAQDYMPLNDTTRSVTLTFTYAPLTLFKFNMYAAMGKENPWSSVMAAQESSDEEQDTIKTTLLETNPYLLGLTVAVSILHSIFEFLAFKNDVQFWRSRKTLEGLSVRSVFFNVFQSVVVLLYIVDNETNYVVIVSVFIGLLIELWKVTKVVEIKFDGVVAGFLPCIKFVDRPSYKSSTRQYDILAFKYLGCLLFPLFICYAIYSISYQEHKGWYSFILGMSYGFLLTFGFITMTPQLFINYKLKSVAHLPWRMLTYKALNTFIDDMFAFVIKMPTMYRIGCFRDDIVFFIFLYQRWIYRVDPKRVNEFGTSGEDSVPPDSTQMAVLPEADSNGVLPERDELPESESLPERVGLPESESLPERDGLPESESNGGLQESDKELESDPAIEKTLEEKKNE